MCIETRQQAATKSLSRPCKRDTRDRSYRPVTRVTPFLKFYASLQHYGISVSSVQGRSTFETAQANAIWPGCAQSRPMQRDGSIASTGSDCTLSSQA